MAEQDKLFFQNQSNIFHIYFLCNLIMRNFAYESTKHREQSN